MTQAIAAGEELALPRARGRLGSARTTVRRGGLGLIGGPLLVLMIAMALAAPLISSNPNFQTDEILAGPSAKYWFGTDNLGRDTFNRIVWGARSTLAVACGAVAVAALIGIVVGLLCGYLRGLFDAVTQRLVDAFMAFPALVFAMALIAAVQPGVLTLALTIGLIMSPGAIRVIRGATLSTSSLAFVEAARAVGASDVRIIVRHILPNTTAPLLVVASVQLGSAALVESSLSFLGLGIPPPDPTWGQMLSGSGRIYMLSQPWLTVFPGVAIMLTVLAANLFGDALRDILDPRLR